MPSPAATFIDNKRRLALSAVLRTYYWPWIASLQSVKTKATWPPTVLLTDNLLGGAEHPVFIQRLPNWGSGETEDISSSLQ